MNFTEYRLKHGLFWAGRYPGWKELKNWIAAILCWALLLIIIGMVKEIEASTERAIMAEMAADIYSAKAKALEDCETRGAKGYYYPASGKAYECSKPL